MKTTIITALFVLIGLHASGQILRYDVFKGDKSVGLMEVNRTFDERKEFIDIRSTTRFRIIMEFVVEYSLIEQFEDDILVEGSGFNSINGGVQKEYDIRKNKYNYTLRFGEVPNRIDHEGIKYTVAKIYFEEPADNRPVFSQHFGRYLIFEEIEPHYYRMTSPDGQNYYRYENGICTEVKVSRDFGTVYFRLKQESFVIVNTPDSLRNK